MIYFIGTPDVVKIGYTSRPIALRLRQLQTASPRALTVLATRPGDRADERALHASLASWRLSGEWFSRSQEVNAAINAAAAVAKAPPPSPWFVMTAGAADDRPRADRIAEQVSSAMRTLPAMYVDPDDLPRLRALSGAHAAVLLDRGSRQVAAFGFFGSTNPIIVAFASRDPLDAFDAATEARSIDTVRGWFKGCVAKGVKKA